MEAFRKTIPLPVACGVVFGYIKGRRRAVERFKKTRELDPVRPMVGAMVGGIAGVVWPASVPLYAVYKVVEYDIYVATTPYSHTFRLLNSLSSYDDDVPYENDMSSTTPVKDKPVEIPIPWCFF